MLLGMHRYLAVVGENVTMSDKPNPDPKPETLIPGLKTPKTVSAKRGVDPDSIETR